MKGLDSSDWEKTQNTTVTERQKTPRTYLKYSGSVCNAQFSTYK